MAVTKAQKQEILSNLIEGMKNAQSIGFAQTNAMSVAEFTQLRNNLREVNASYTLAKKTLIKLAAKQALDIELNLDDLPGQIGVVFSNEDAIAGLSKTNDFIKQVFNKKQEVQKITWIASIFEGEWKDIEATKIIASMPSRETLLSRLVGSMMSPVSSLARFFDAAAKEMEEKGVDTLSKLDAPKVEKTEAKEEAPATEETPVQDEKKDETPAETETPTEATPDTEENKES